MGTDYKEPRTVEETCGLLAEYGEGATILAGGTALVLAMRQGLVTPRCLVNIRHVAGLDAIERDAEGGLLLGATATHRDALRSPHVRDHHSGLVETFSRVGTPRIRNAGTVGGNFAQADPSFDPPVMLMALDGSVRKQSVDGCRELPVADLFDDSSTNALRDEIITGVFAPPREPRSGSAFLKFVPHSRPDHSVRIAVWIRLDDEAQIEAARLVVGFPDVAPARTRIAEDALTGLSADDPTEPAGERAADEALGEGAAGIMSDYLRHATPALVGRALGMAFADVRRTTKP